MFFIDKNFNNKNKTEDNLDQQNKNKPIMNKFNKKYNKNKNDNINKDNIDEDKNTYYVKSKQNYLNKHGHENPFLFIYNLLFTKESENISDKEFEKLCINIQKKKLNGKNNKNVNHLEKYQLDQVL